MPDNEQPEARQLLDHAHNAYRDSSRPVQPAAANALHGVLAGVGIAALGQLPGAWPGHLLAIAAGVALMTLAFLLPTRARSRAGVHGYRGRTRDDNVVFLLVAVTLIVAAISATTTTSAIYLALGIVGGVTYSLVLARHPLISR